MNSGGRLHDDFNGSNKDIYVENYTSTPGNDLIVRVRLREYMELTEEDGTVAAKSDPTQTKESKDTWPIYRLSGTVTYQGNEATDEYQEHYDADHPYSRWTFGGQTTYLPTANKDNDSQDADINGTLAGKDGVPYGDYVDHAAEGTPGSKQTLDGTVISMTQWQTNRSQLGSYWVYDTDGWAYWAQPLKPGEATGLLLSAIDVKIPEDYAIYYGIYVESQMVTAGEIDKLKDFDGGVTEAGKALLNALAAEIGTPTITAADDPEGISLEPSFEEKRPVVIEPPTTEDEKEAGTEPEEEQTPSEEDRTPADGDETLDKDEEQNKDQNKDETDPPEQDSETIPETPTEAPDTSTETPDETPQQPPSDDNENKSEISPSDTETGKDAA